MSEYKSRINIQVKNVSDWEKLFEHKDEKRRMVTWRRCKKSFQSAVFKKTNRIYKSRRVVCGF